MGILERFPKVRPSLPEAYREIYAEHYRQNRAGVSPASAMAKRMEAWMHRKVAEDIAGVFEARDTLEIGAGTLNHLDYERPSGRYDVVEPFVDLYTESPNRRFVTREYRDISEITGTRFDRVISIATFEHLCDLPAVVRRCGLLLSPRGRLRVAIPSEGTILWTLGWKLTTGVEFRLRHSLDYGVLMRHEHVNTAAEIGEVLRLFFENVKQSVFGVSPALSFYQFFECSDFRSASS